MLTIMSRENYMYHEIYMLRQIYIYAISLGATEYIFEITMLIKKIIGFLMIVREECSKRRM